MSSRKINTQNYASTIDTQTAGQNIYTGMRYVPIFDDTWSEEKAYEPLTIVDYTDELGNKGTYVSKWFVEIGVKPTDSKYWMEVFNFTPEFNAVSIQVNTLQSIVSKHLTESTNKFQSIDNSIDSINSELANIDSRVVALEKLATGSDLLNALVTEFGADNTGANDCSEAIGNMANKYGIVIFYKGFFNFNSVNNITKDTFFISISAYTDGVIDITTNMAFINIYGGLVIRKSSDNNKAVSVYNSNISIGDSSSYKMTLSNAKISNYLKSNPVIILNENGDEFDNTSIYFRNVTVQTTSNYDGLTNCVFEGCDLICKCYDSKISRSTIHGDNGNESFIYYSNLDHVTFSGNDVNLEECTIKNVENENPIYLKTVNNSFFECPIYLKGGNYYGVTFNGYCDIQVNITNDLVFEFNNSVFNNTTKLTCNDMNNAGTVTFTECIIRHLQHSYRGLYTLNSIKVNSTEIAIDKKDVYTAEVLKLFKSDYYDSLTFPIIYPEIENGKCVLSCTVSGLQGNVRTVNNNEVSITKTVV